MVKRFIEELLRDRAARRALLRSLTPESGMEQFIHAALGYGCDLYPEQVLEALFPDAPTQRGKLMMYEIGEKLKFTWTDHEGRIHAQSIGLPPDFSHLFAPAEPAEMALTAAEAQYVLNFMAMTADGEATTDETRVAADLLIATGYSADQVAKLARRIHQALNDEGAPRVFRTAKDALNTEQRREALRQLTQITCADQVLRTSEEDFLLAAAAALDVPQTEARDMMAEILLAQPAVTYEDEAYGYIFNTTNRRVEPLPDEEAFAALCVLCARHFAMNVEHPHAAETLAELDLTPEFFARVYKRMEAETLSQSDAGLFSLTRGERPEDWPAHVMRFIVAGMLAGGVLTPEKHRFVSELARAVGMEGAAFQHLISQPGASSRPA